MLNPEHCNLTIMASKRKYYKELQTINRNIFLHNWFCFILKAKIYGITK